MRISLVLPLIALVCLSTAPATASVLLNTVDGGQYFETRDSGDAILTFVVVGASNVTIGAFGPYGEMLASGDAKWIILDYSDPTTPVFVSAPVALGAATAPEFYDIEGLSFTLQANHSYFMGLIANVPFSYGWEFQGFSAVATAETANGLTAPVGPNGNATGFDSPAWDGQGLVQQSIRIDDAAVPEPSAIILLASGLGMLIIRRARASKRS